MQKIQLLAAADHDTMNMTTTETIEIPLSKKKLAALLVASIVFVALGLWFVISPPDFDGPLFRNPTLVRIIGVASFLFFSLAGFVGIRKLMDKRPGLIIDTTGITDNASGVSAGHIPWSDIVAIQSTEVFNQKFLIVLVKNPDHYIERQASVIKRKGMQMNYKQYGSPISISASTLKCNFDELKNTLQKQLDKYRS
ncbi:MAG: STM3941 family protein [Bacteroidota bacterium]